MGQGMPSLAIDRASPVPLYYQVAQHLEHLIESGASPGSTRLENEIVLAEQLGLSRPTMRRAIQYLVDRGLLVRKRGVGTQVVQPGASPVELSSLYDDLRAAGREPRTDVLAFTVERPSKVVAEVLGLVDGTEVYAVKRLRFTGDEPLVIMRNYLPVGLVALDAESLRARGLYELLRGAGITLKIATDHRRSGGQADRGPAAARETGRGAADHDPHDLRRHGPGGRVRITPVPSVAVHLRADLDDRVTQMKRITHWIDGKPFAGESERTGDVFDPALGVVSGRVDFAPAAVVDEAVAAATRAFDGMARVVAGRSARGCFPVP